MKKRRGIVGTAALVCLAAVATAAAQTATLPYSGGTFKGRIPLSHDGNYNDEDDWGAFPVAIAILDAMALKSKLVHAHFNNVLPYNDDTFAAEMRTSALGAQQRYGLSRAIFYDCQNATERTNAINYYHRPASNPISPLRT